MGVLLDTLAVGLKMVGDRMKQRVGRLKHVEIPSEEVGIQSTKARFTSRT